MTYKKWLKGLCALVAALAFAACADDGEQEGQAKAGVRGETCRSSADCRGGLACVGGTCRVETFELAPTGKECVLVECSAPEDCCLAQEPSACEEYRADCAAGDMIACSTVESLCCNPEEWTCENDTCSRICSSDADCFGQTGAALVCDSGRCVECVNDSQCGEDARCIENACIEDCEKDTDCPVFYACQSGSCEHVGCANDRECVAQSRNPLAFCEDTVCIEPCESDFECDDYDAFDFRACVDKRCVSVGCETHEECRAQFDIQDGSPFDAECRDESSIQR